MDGYHRLKSFNSGLLTNLVSGLVVVDKSITEKQRDEADAAGLTLISKSSSPNYNLYKFKSCSHTSFLQPTHVRRNAFKCETCYVNTLSLSINLLGDFFVCRLDSTKQKVIRSCGHVFNTHHAHKRKMEISKCSSCFEEALQKIASDHNYEVLSFEGGSWKDVKLKECNHVKSVHISQILKGNIVCRVCAEDAHIRIVEDNGLKLLKRNEDRYNEYLLPCGCRKVIRKDHAEGNNWLCSTCNNSHYSKPSNVYLLEIGNKEFKWLKLGFAKDIYLRIKNYGLSKDSKVILLSSVNFNNGYDALLFEKSLHKKYKSRRLDPKFMESYHTFNGHTECYSLDVKDELLEEISLKESQFV